MSRHLFLSTILVACVLTCFADSENTYRLRQFYWRVAVKVQEECRRYLYSKVHNTEYHTDRQRTLRDKMAIDIGKIDRLWLDIRGEKYYDLCFWFEAFKLAKEILFSYNEIKEAFNNEESTLLNENYITVALQCQELTFNPDDLHHTLGLSLLLTNGSSGLGKFMGRSDRPGSWCCDFLDRVDLMTHRLELMIYEKPPERTNVRYCDIVAIWNDNKFLKNEGLKMEWDAYTWSEKVKWKIQPFCNDPTNDRTISHCDLVTFRTLNPYELDGYYLVSYTTSQTKSNGVFAVWHQDGAIVVPPIN